MTESTPEYVPPTHFTQVLVTRDLEFQAIADAMNEALGNEDKDLEISLVGANPPPYSADNRATLTVAAPGREFSVDQVKGILADVPDAAAPAPTTAAPEPVFDRDPDLEETPSEPEPQVEPEPSQA